MRFIENAIAFVLAIVLFPFIIAGVAYSLARLSFQIGLLTVRAKMQRERLE